jgi:dsDNA-specific endonuclease/ATPase MutS2
MSLDIAISELSKQIARLQSELDIFRGNNNDLNSFSKEANKKRKKHSKVKSRFSLMLYKMQQERYNMLCEKYKDEIAFIQKRDPGWMPPKRFFEI